MAKFVCNVKNLCATRAVLFVFTRNSQFSPAYVNPIVKKEDLKNLKQNKDEYEKMKFTPVKPAKISESSSLYRNEAVDGFVHIMLKHGDKDTALDMMRLALLEIKKAQLIKYRNAKTDEERAAIELNPMVVFEKGLENCKPLMMTKKIKRGGATYQVPFPVTRKTSTFWAMKWLNDMIRWRPRPMLENFQTVMSKEILSALNNEGKVVKKKQDLHKLCEANKAYAHYRWS
ncbi:mitochondrial ribosomal protein S7-like protein [Leptotrombidium deliense]|uniref:Mitochondrial ribosomal protein S7-like protein n=1 Tax=Leptotrombidium deliense TaxID=299467 RepID=A0A443SST5_9ACAR|nr:mitochondrial ribosomal protein S7-like protein [Leptotrombidium deliense]